MAIDNTEEIILRVSHEAAQAFRRATPQERLKLETLVSLQLIGRLKSQRPLDAIIQEMSKQARDRGLTPEALDEILRDDA